MTDFAPLARIDRSAPVAQHLLEARDLGWGASTRNAGMMIVGLKHGPQVLVKKFGEELGRKLLDTTLEANRFVDITQKRETAREAAHADILKAQLQQQQRQRELEKLPAVKPAP